MTTVIDRINLHIKHICRGELIITRCERRGQGIYEFRYMPDKGKIPEEVWKKVRNEYFEYYDRETFHYFHKSFSYRAINFDCRIKGKEKMLEVMKKEFKNYKGEL